MAPGMRRDAETEVLGALDALVSACELPGDHCEVEQALPAAITVIAKALGVPPNPTAKRAPKASA